MTHTFPTFLIAVVLFFAPELQLLRRPSRPDGIDVQPGRGPVLYPDVPLATIAAGKWTRPRARITGTVTVVRKEEDGDWHVRVVDGRAFIICEITPQQPHPRPKVGQRVRMSGVVRYDGQHRWWEIHPVDHWKPVAP